MAWAMNELGQERIYMKKINFSNNDNKKFRIPMNLQFFADGDGGGDDDDGAGKEGGDVDDSKHMSFDDFLKLEGNQGEFDRRIQKATKTAIANAEEKWKLLHDDQISEAERLAKMSKEEKAAYQTKKLQEELDSYKRKEAREEMAKTARKMLHDEEVIIPDELLSHLIADDADSTKEAVESFASLFKGAVQEAVKDALKGKTPKGGKGANTITREQILAISDSYERQKLIRENISLFPELS